MMNIKVALVEDNSSLRESLSELVNSVEDLVCIGAYGNAEEFLQKVKSVSPHVVLMDIGLPGMSGVEAVFKLREYFPSAEVLMLTIYEDDKRIFDAICAGASGYLLKRTPPEKIVNAIHDIYRGGAPMTPKVARRVLALFRDTNPAISPSSRLSPREQEVLNELVNGLSYKMIADHLEISIDTVRSHIKHIYKKLHVNSNAQAINIALRSKHI